MRAQAVVDLANWIATHVVRYQIFPRRTSAIGPTKKFFQFRRDDDAIRVFFLLTFASLVRCR